MSSHVLLGAFAAAIVAMCVGGCELAMNNSDRIARAEQSLRRGDVKGAIVDLKKVLQKDADDSRARLLLVRAELANAEVAAASADFQKVDPSKVSAPEFDRLRWNLWLAERRFRDVLKELAAPRPTLGEPERLFLLARAQVGLGEADAARPLLDRVVRMDSRNEEARALLGINLASTASIAEAVDYLQTAAEQRPKSFPVRRALADVLLRSGDPVRAEAEYRAALALTDADADLVTHLAVAGGLADSLLAQNKLDEAEGVADDVAKLAPSLVLTYLLRGRVAAAKRDFPTARENLQRVLNANPDSAQLLTLLAAVNLQQGSTEQAIVNLQRALAADPTFVTTRRLLAQAFSAQGRREDALRILDEGNDATATADPQLMQARAALAAGEGSRADSMLGQLEWDPAASDEARLDLATTYLQAGKPDRALQLLDDSKSAPTERREQLRLVALVSQDRHTGVQALLDYAEKHGQPLARIQFAAFALAGAGETNAAFKLLGDYADAHPKEQLALTSLATLQVRDGRFNDAGLTLKRALDIGPNVDVLLGLAQLAARQGRHDEATRLLEQARTVDPKAAAPRAALVRRYVAQGKLDAAQKAVEELLHIDAKNAEARLLATAVAFERKDYAAALRSVNEAIRLAPQSALAWLVKGHVHVRLSQKDDARSALNRAIELAPKASEPLYSLALLEYDEGNSAAAFSVARKAQQREDSRAIGLTLEADLLFRQGKTAEAVRAYERRQAAQPSSQGALALYRACVRAGTASPERALVDWMAVHPDDVVVHSALAAHWQRIGQNERAIAQYEAAVKLQPNSPVLLNNLAWLYAESSDRRALPTARRAYELAPGNPAVADTLAWSLLAANQPEEAVRLLRDAAILVPESAEMQYHLATALLRVGDKAGATAIANRFERDGVAAAWREKFAALVRE